MSVYDYVNERIMKALEQGTIPWQRPWRCEGYGNPLNGVYHGSNIMMAGIHNMVNDFKSPHFLTLNQIKKLGGWVEDIDNYCMITYFKFIPKKHNKEETFPMLRYYRTYNLEQSGLPKGLFSAPAEHINVNPFEFQYGYQGGPQVFYDQKTRAYYSPGKDEVHLPEVGEFLSETKLKATLFHELAHSTGHKTRLDREKDSYAKEELVAEMAAAFMMHECGYEVEYENHATYIAGWANKISEDKTLFVSAAGKAEKATEYIFSHPNEMEVAV